MKSLSLAAAFLLSTTSFVFADDNTEANRLYVNAALNFNLLQALPLGEVDARLGLLSTILEDLDDIVTDYSGSEMAVEIASTGIIKQLNLADLKAQKAQLDDVVKCQDDVAPCLLKFAEEGLHTLELDPKQRPIDLNYQHQYYAEALAYGGNWSKADAYVSGMVDDQMKGYTQADAWINIAYAQIEAGQIDLAYQSLSKASQSGRALQTTLVEFLTRQGDFDNADKVSRSGEFPELYYFTHSAIAAEAIRLGYIEEARKFALDAYTGAKADFKYEIDSEYDPEYSGSVDLALVLLRLGEIEKAEELIAPVKQYLSLQSASTDGKALAPVRYSVLIGDLDAVARVATLVSDHRSMDSTLQEAVSELNAAGKVLDSLNLIGQMATAFEISEGLASVAEVYAAQGDEYQARALLQQAEATWEKTEAVWESCRASKAIARAYLKLEDKEAAFAVAGKLSHSVEIKTPYDVGYYEDSVICAVEIADEIGDPVQTNELLKTAYAYVKSRPVEEQKAGDYYRFAILVYRAVQPYRSKYARE